MIQKAIWSVPVAWGLAYLPIAVRAIVVGRFGKLNNSKPRDIDGQTSKMPDQMKELADRLRSCHLNQIETLGYYAAGVAVAVAAHVPAANLVRLTGLYIKSRIAYSFAYAAPQVANGALRTIAFVSAMVSIGMLYAAAAESAIAIY